MPGAAARNEAAACHFAAGAVVLQRHFECRLDRFRAARDEHHGIQRARTAAGADDERAQLLERVRGEGVAVAVCNALELAHDGRGDFGMPVTEAKERGSAGSIEVALAGGVVDIDARAVGDLRQTAAPSPASRPRGYTSCLRHTPL